MPGLGTGGHTYQEQACQEGKMMAVVFPGGGHKQHQDRKTVRYREGDRLLIASVTIFQPILFEPDLGWPGKIKKGWYY